MQSDLQQIEQSRRESRRAAQLHATAHRWLGGMLQIASVTQEPLKDLWCVLYPVAGRRGRRRDPRATRLYIAWRVRILVGRGFSPADAHDLLVIGHFGQAACLSDLGRAQNDLDGLVRSIESKDGWQVPPDLNLPRSVGVPQSDTARRKARQRAQHSMFERLRSLRPKIPEQSDRALMWAALDDGKMRRFAEDAQPTELRAKRPRGRPRKRSAQADASGDWLREADANEWTNIEREIIEAVLRFSLHTARIAALCERLISESDLVKRKELDAQITGLRQAA
jgi:hypothetical protein